MSGFVDYVKRLRYSNTPRPFSSEICYTIYEIVKGSDIDMYSMIQKDVKMLDSDEIDFLL